MLLSGVLNKPKDDKAIHTQEIQKPWITLQNQEPQWMK